LWQIPNCGGLIRIRNNQLLQCEMEMSVFSADEIETLSSEINRQLLALNEVSETVVKSAESGDTETG
jgi:hypothetical protein